MMKISRKQIIKNFYYVLSSNLLSLLISVVVVLIVPKVIGVTEYGYWQLFTFYASYFGVLSLGWWDGIYLKYGGTRFDELTSYDSRVLKVQFFQVVSLGILIAIVILFKGIFSKTFNETSIFLFLSINFPLYVIQNFLKSIFQATNVLKKYANSVVLSNTIYIAGVLLLIALNIADFKWILISYTLGNLISSIVLINDAWNILHHNRVSLISYFNFNESWENIKSGFSVLTANLAGMLIVGVVRLGIKYGWSVATFGKISLTLSITNFAMLFVGAIGLVAYPVLRNISRERINNVYQQMHALLMLILFSMMLIYFPIRIFLPMWLPKYQESLIYMAILFPVLVYQGKFELLTNTLYKVFRYEKKLFVVNAITVLCSVICTIISIYLLHSLTFSILSLIVALQFRSIVGEILLSITSYRELIKDISTEIIVISVFIVSAWYFNTFVALITYCITVVVFLSVFYTDIMTSLKMIFNKNKLSK